MIDDIDRIADRDQALLDAALADVCAAAASMPAGEPGECVQCGETFARLVDGRCGFCRDGRARP